MENINFDRWIHYRRNEPINEFFGGTLFNRSKPDDAPEEPNQIYSHPKVGKYVKELLSHLNMGAGANLETLDNNGATTGTITVTDWATQNPDFYKAFQRFIAGHAIGKGSEKSFLRISYHDAVIIIKTLDSLRIPGHRLAISDEYHIDTPKSLSLWVQGKLPTDPSALLQYDYLKQSDEFGNIRSTARPKSNPLSIKPFADIVEKGRDVLIAASTTGSGSRLRLYKALNALKQEIESHTQWKLPEPSNPSRDSSGGSGAPGRRSGSPT